MGTEYYLADMCNKRILLMGKHPGRMLSDYLRTAPANLDPTALRDAIRCNWAEMVDNGLASEDVDVHYLDSFAVKVWAFCASTKWTASVRSDAHDYADEVYDDDDPRGTPIGWAVTGSWYVSDVLDPDPVAEEQARWEAAAWGAIAAKPESFIASPEARSALVLLEDGKPDI